jgi:hypothetical protein
MTENKEQISHCYVPLSSALSGFSRRNAALASVASSSLWEIRSGGVATGYVYE